MWFWFNGNLLLTGIREANKEMIGIVGMHRVFLRETETCSLNYLIKEARGKLLSEMKKLVDNHKEMFD